MRVTTIFALMCLFVGLLIFIIYGSGSIVREQYAAVGAIRSLVNERDRLRSELQECKREHEAAKRPVLTSYIVAP